MTALQPHRILLGGIPLPSTRYGFSWRFQPGVDPFIGVFTVPGNREQEFRDIIGKKVSLEIDYQVSTPEGVESRSSTIENLYPLKMWLDSDGLNEVFKIYVADLRWKWAGLPMRIGYVNWLRRLNDADVVVDGNDLNVPGQVREVNGAEVKPDVPGGWAPVDPVIVIAADGELEGKPVVANFRQANIKGKFNSVPVRGYSKYTLDWQDGSAKVWRALSLAKFILTGGKVQTSSGLLDASGILSAGEFGGILGNADDYADMPIPKRAYFGTPAKQALSEALKLARARLHVWVDGKVYIMPIDMKQAPILPAQPIMQESIRLTMHDNAVERPSSVISLFRREKETQFAVIAANQSAPDNIAENVIRIPSALTVDLGGGDGPREYAAQTYLPLEPVLLTSEYGGITTEQVRQWKTKGLLNMWLLHMDIPSFAATDADRAKVSAIDDCFRRTFKLKDTFVERLVSMSAESVVIVDAQSGQRAPAPVWVDYAIRRGLRYDGATVARAELIWENITYDKAAGTAGDPASGALASPFRVNVIDDKIGVFEISPQKDQLGGIVELVISNVVFEDGKQPKTRREFDGFNLSQGALSEEFGMATRLTTIELDPNTVDQFYALEIKAADVGESRAYCHPYFVSINDETARFDKDGNLVNEKMVKNRALAEAQLVYYSWQDRLHGKPMWAGLHEIRPVGYAAFVDWSLRSEGYFVTTLDMQEPPPGKSIEQQLPAWARWLHMGLAPLK